MISRRSFIHLGSATLADVALTSSASAQDKGQVVIAESGGTYVDALREAMYKPFEKATGIKVVEALQPLLGKMRAMAAAGNAEYDLVDTIPTNFHVLAKEGVLERIDYNAMDRSVFADFPKEFIHPYGVATGVYSGVITFNTKKYTQATAPKGWPDFWNTRKFPGPRILFANIGWSPVEIALLADGVPKDKLYPVDFKRAYAALDRIRPHILKWANSTSVVVESVVAGEADLAIASQGRVQLAKDQGAPIDYVWDGALTENSWWTIPKGAKNPKNALEFLEFYSRAENQAALAKAYLMSPTNRKALDMLPVARAKMMPTYSENLPKLVFLDHAWWSQTDASGKTNIDVNNSLWNAWVLQR